MVPLSIKKKIKINFLSCQVKDYQELLDGDRHLILGSCQNPQAASVIQHGHLRSGSPPCSSGLRAVSHPMTCLSEGWA